MTVLVEAAPTTCESTAEVDAAKGADPAYTAVTDLVPAVGWATVHDAEPELSVEDPPEQLIKDPASRKVTDPLGRPEAAVTVAV
jgi:hypothetical protein